MLIIDTILNWCFPPIFLKSMFSPPDPEANTNRFYRESPIYLPSAHHGVALVISISFGCCRPRVYLERIVVDAAPVIAARVIASSNRQEQRRCHVLSRAALRPRRPVGARRRAAVPAATSARERPSGRREQAGIAAVRAREKRHPGEEVPDQGSGEAHERHADQAGGGHGVAREGSVPGVPHVSCLPRVLGVPRFASFLSDPNHNSAFRLANSQYSRVSRFASWARCLFAKLLPTHDCVSYLEMLVQWCLVSRFGTIGISQRRARRMTNTWYL